MKKVLLLILFMFSICIYGEEVVNEAFNIEQPSLEELSLFTIRDEIKSSEVIIVMSNEINRIKLELTMAQKRMDLMDKIIADKNQLTDELNNRVEILNFQIKDYQEREQNSKNGFEKEVMKKIYQTGAIIALTIILIFIVTLSFLLLQGAKAKKRLEELKDMLELKTNRVDLMDENYKKYCSLGTKEEIKDDLNFIIKG